MVLRRTSYHVIMCEHSIIRYGISLFFSNISNAIKMLEKTDLTYEDVTLLCIVQENESKASFQAPSVLSSQSTRIAGTFNKHNLGNIKMRIKVGKLTAPFITCVGFTPT